MCPSPSIASIRQPSTTWFFRCERKGCPTVRSTVTHARWNVFSRGATKRATLIISFDFFMLHAIRKSRCLSDVAGDFEPPACIYKILSKTAFASTDFVSHLSQAIAPHLTTLTRGTGATISLPDSLMMAQLFYTSLTAAKLKIHLFIPVLLCSTRSLMRKRLESVPTF